MSRRKVVCVTVGENRLPAGVAEQIREFADFRVARCETPEDLLRTFPDAEVQWMFGPNLCLKPEALARMMSGFDMRVLHHDPFAPGSVPLETLLRESDYVSVHCPLTQDTRGLLNAERLALMRNASSRRMSPRSPAISRRTSSRIRWRSCAPSARRCPDHSTTSKPQATIHFYRAVALAKAETTSH